MKVEPSKQLQRRKNDGINKVYKYVENGKKNRVKLKAFDTVISKNVFRKDCLIRKAGGGEGWMNGRDIAGGGIDER